uniref:NADH dehydrogenase subunit 6 n=1 Tax=Agenioideus sp. SJW-2017 TaxID=1940100 RepID=A0A1P8VH86_9HYME|nr:NADH dehydrogenase subunit 6 [Agenioideus sp. SJW-2017]
MMDKLSVSMNFIYMITVLWIVMILMVPISIMPSLPVFYLMFMLFYAIFLVIYLMLVSNSVLSFFVYLIVVGGIMITFLFFLSFSSLENKWWIFFNLMLFVVACFFFMLLAYMSITQESAELMMETSVNSNKCFDMCYSKGQSFFLTMMCMTYLLFVMFITIKISTLFKSSPMRSI